MFYIVKNRGFTLPEVMISIAIFLIISSIIIANYRFSENSNTFRMSAYEVEDSIDMTYNIALTGKRINDIIPDSGYGINFNKETDYYTIFGNMTAKTGEEDCEKVFNSAPGITCSNSQIDQVSFSSGLPNGISIDSFACNGVNVANNNLNIIFYPPRASMRIFVYKDASSEYTDFTECTNSTIYLKSTKNSGTWEINISTSTGRYLSSFSDT